MPAFKIADGLNMPLPPRLRAILRKPEEGDKHEKDLGPFGVYHAGRMEAAEKGLETDEYQREHDPQSYWLSPAGIGAGAALGALSGGFQHNPFRTLGSMAAGPDVVSMPEGFSGVGAGVGALAGGAAGMLARPVGEMINKVRRTYHANVGQMNNKKGPSALKRLTPYAGLGALLGSTAGALSPAVSYIAGNRGPDGQLPPFSPDIGRAARWGLAGAAGGAGLGLMQPDTLIRKSLRDSYDKQMPKHENYKARDEQDIVDQIKYYLNPGK